MPVVDTSASETLNRGDLIAVVDDDESVRNAVSGVLRSVGLKPQTFGSAEEFLSSGQQSVTVCLITDVQMPGMGGLELQTKLATEGHRIPVIFISAYGNPRLRDQAWRLGAVQFLDKPFDDEILLDIIREVVDQ
jgi:FixJ family two-component response regulator